MGGNGREIDRTEALSTLERNQKDGLVLQPSNTRRADFICSCCGCCCGMLRMQRNLPRPTEFWASNYFASVDPAACDGCGACARRCQVEAVRLSKTPRRAVVDPYRCIGCGLCTTVCKPGAIALEKKPTMVEPPPDREALFDILMANKKGAAQKMALAGKLLLDLVRSRNLRPLR
jgi:ferredoxin